MRRRSVRFHEGAPVTCSPSEHCSLKPWPNIASRSYYNPPCQRSYSEVRPARSPVAASLQRSGERSLVFVSACIVCVASGSAYLRTGKDCRRHPAGQFRASILRHRRRPDDGQPSRHYCEECCKSLDRAGFFLGECLSLTRSHPATGTFKSPTSRKRRVPAT